HHGLPPLHRATVATCGTWSLQDGRDHARVRVIRSSCAGDSLPRMELRSVGRTGLRVSRLGLGTMTWDRDTEAGDAREQLVAFLDAGGTLVDTAASYADGAAEALLGSLIADGVAEREDLVLCTKGGVRRTDEGGIVDASRGSLLASLDASLRRLGTDHVDLWLVQAPDPRTPLTETVDALRTAVRSGRARYVGLSNHPGW